MTTQQLPAPPMAPMPLDEVFAYYLSLLFATNRADALDVLRQISDRLAEDFEDGMEALVASSGLEVPPPMDRLTFYYGKPKTGADAMWLASAGIIPAPYSWEQQQAQYPRDFEHDWADFQKLRERARKGDFGLALQLQELQWQQQEMEQARLAATAQAMGARL